MDRMLYVAASGAHQIQLAQTANSNNLANANTTGFMADLAAFRSQPVFGPGQPSRVYAMAEKPGVDFSRGNLQNTGRALDVAVNGPGFIAVQAPDGSEAYTRRGDLKVSSTGLLTNGAGHPVLGNGGPIVLPPSSKIDIGADGTISVLPPGQNPSTMAVVDRIKLVDPKDGALNKSRDGLLHTRSGKPAQADASVQLVSGTLESSNVDTVSAMVNMIELARRFEMQVQMMKTGQQNDAA
ncbi:MAG TPA: flagellar basal-body rod protein FlgF, partial [Gammaproteobacteria bacterium]|nr:flagellar basal-body rod protein FlgF [Gammaproteobacteria bacterium]